MRKSLRRAYEGAERNGWCIERGHIMVMVDDIFKVLKTTDYETHPASIVKPTKHAVRIMPFPRVSGHERGSCPS